MTDAHHNFVYPQPPFNISDEMCTKMGSVLCAANPSIIQVNELHIGINPNLNPNPNPKPEPNPNPNPQPNLNP